MGIKPSSMTLMEKTIEYSISYKELDSLNEKMLLPILQGIGMPLYLAVNPKTGKDHLVPISGRLSWEDRGTIRRFIWKGDESYFDYLNRMIKSSQSFLGESYLPPLEPLMDDITYGINSINEVRTKSPLGNQQTNKLKESYLDDEKPRSIDLTHED